MSTNFCIKNERHSVEYQSIPKKGVRSDSVIVLSLILGLVLVILELLVLLALVARITAAEDEEADCAAHKEHSEGCVDKNDVNMHEEAVLKLIAILLNGSLELQVPGFSSHVDWLLKSSAGSDHASSWIAPDGSENNPDDEIGQWESQVDCTDDLASFLLVLHEDNGEDENRHEDDGGPEAPGNPGVEDLVHLHGVALSDLDSELGGTDNCLLTGTFTLVHISNDPARGWIRAIEGEDGQ